MVYSQNDQVAARKLVSRVHVKISQLIIFPEMGRIVPELQDPIIRELIFKKYLIIYQIHKDEIEIITVEHLLTSPLNHCGGVCLAISS
ncbi:MAG TPA: type II toxin-antitoxin system RelE/ParE family toxin [Candidatus Lokiarchaeia archaeon]|nr:type II toxin-antitoxin system RelE/ParE family toxin [Candidatus Lokiarchaeia archaeon]